jgi:hypothetical protein
MTIGELLDKNKIDNTKIKTEKGITILKIKEMNVIFWINEGNVFKMKRTWFEMLEENCKQYSLFLYDKKDNKYFYIKFQNKNNWVSSGFNNCDKSEVFLGKQVLNYPSTINKILVDLKKCSI